MAKKSRGATVALLVGACLVVAVAVAVKFTRHHLRFWYVFEPLGKNEHGYPEYKHRQTGIVFVRVPGGKFRMGIGDPDEKRQIEDLVSSGGRIPRGVPMRPIGMLRTERPAHEVALSSYLIAKYEVTQAEWGHVMGSSPARLNRENMPVESVSWNDCEEFCKKTSLKLPTEAQWEYACRAGTAGPYGGKGRLDDMGWYRDNSGGTTQPIGQKEPNGFGLHDMHGNVFEWCEDVYDRDFYSKPEARTKDPLCTSGSSFRVHRGGSRQLHALGCRSASRGCLLPSDPYGNGSGFRPAYYPVP